MMEQFNKSQEVTVKSNYNGRLHFRSKKTGGYADWDEYGTIQILTIEDLLDMRNNQSRFFSENWILIDEPNAADIYKFLRVDKYYNSIVDVQEYMQNINRKKPETIEKDISACPKGVKTTIASIAMEMYKNGKIDSIKTIRAIEGATGYEFTKE